MNQVLGKVQSCQDMELACPQVHDNLVEECLYHLPFCILKRIFTNVSSIKFPSNPVVSMEFVTHILQMRKLWVRGAKELPSQV